MGITDKVNEGREKVDWMVDIVEWVRSLINSIKGWFGKKE